MIHIDTDSLWFKLILFVLIVTLVIVIIVCVKSHTQTQMSGGVVINKNIVEAHTLMYSYYDATTKTVRLQTIYVPTTYYLTVQKELNGKNKIKEISVSIEKYYMTNIGEIYFKN